MTSSSDAAVRDLERRLEELELTIVRIIGTVALVALLIGSLLPWIRDEVDGEEQTVRLATFVLGALSTTDELNGAEVLLVISFVIFDLTTIAAAVCVGYAMGGHRERSWISSTIIGLLVCCLVGAGLVTVMADLAGATESSSTGVHWTAYLTWALGALISLWVLTTTLGRRVPTGPRPVKPSSRW